MDYINSVLTPISDFIYVYILIALLIFCGVYFTVITKFSQIRFFPEALRSINERPKGGKVSSFQALMICTASKVGTANIAGVATAVVIGGPGAMFWMWIMAVIGSASSMAESTLAQIYKVKSKDGKSFVGGPAYYIEKAFGNKKISMIFSSLFVFCFLFGFNALQAHNMSSSLKYYIPNYENTVWPYVVGIVLASVVSFVVFGGMKRIGFVSSYLVPAMASIYILAGLYIILTNFSKIPDAFSAILSSAFNFKSIFGGMSGSVLLIGIKRGLLSNEAGMGSAPNAAASADTSHPAKQGIAQILSVFIDTILICSTSAFILLLSGVDLNSSLSGMPLMQKALESQLGIWGVHFITLSVTAFAFSAIIGNFGLSEPNITFIKDSPKLSNAFRLLGIFSIIFGCVATASVAWNLADISMAFIAIVNIITILKLSKRYKACLDDYIKQRKENKEPVFKAEDCGITDTTLWK